MRGQPEAGSRKNPGFLSPKPDSKEEAATYGERAPPARAREASLPGRAAGPASAGSAASPAGSRSLPGGQRGVLSLLGDHLEHARRQGLAERWQTKRALIFKDQPVTVRGCCKAQTAQNACVHSFCRFSVVRTD